MKKIKEKENPKIKCCHIPISHHKDPPTNQGQERGEGGEAFY
jgi:hypothetical protein